MGKKIIVSSVFLVLISILLYRCFFGFDWSDETYYLALPYRYVMGNSLFSDSWDIHQTSAIILAPFVSLYRTIHGSSDGIILFFRICYVVFQTSVSLLIFKIMKKYTDIWCASCSALLFLVFVPFIIINFSYNTLSLGFLCITCFLLMDSVYSPVSGLKIFLSGICYALAVQAYPFVIITLPILFILFLVKLRQFKVWLYFLAGVFTIILVFIFYILYNSSLSDLLTNYKYILDNPEHSYNNLLKPIRSYFKYIYWTFTELVWVNLIVLLFTCVSRFISHETWKKHINTYLYFMAMILVICNIVFVLTMDIETPRKLNNYLCIPLTAAGPIFYIISNFKRKGIFMFMWILGLLYSIAIVYASNTGINGAVYGLIISAIASLALMLSHSIKLKPKLNISKKVIIGAVCCLQIFSMLYLRTFTAYRDDPVLQLDTRLSTGPAKGIYTTSENAEKYQDIIYAIDRYIPDHTTVFFSALLPFGYLCDLEPSTPILWTLPIDSDMFHTFFSLYPDKFPECILILNQDYGIHNERNGENSENILYEYMKPWQYKRIELDCGVFFIRRMDGSSTPGP